MITYNLNDRVFLTIKDDDSITIGELAGDREEVILTPEETKSMIEMLIDHNLYDPWMV